ncbi:MAG: sugar phosphate isomerase/epimerase [Syntrophobacteraceae bacterium]
MVSFINESKTGPGPGPRNQGDVAISPAMRAVLERVSINMPWAFFHRYRDLVLDNRINVELGFGAGELEETPIPEISEAVGALRDRGCRITAHGPFWDLCPGSIDPGIREVSRSRLLRLFEILEHVRPAQIVCHTGFDPRHHRGHRAEWLENSAAVWGHFIERAERLGAPLLLENVWEEDPGPHLELFAKLDSPWFGFCLDTGHQNAFSKTPLERWLDATAGRLMEIHIHDNDGSDDHHLPVGRGNIDFDYLFGFLDANGLRPVLTLEPHRDEHLYACLDALSRMESFKKFLK